MLSKIFKNNSFSMFLFLQYNIQDFVSHTFTFINAKIKKKFGYFNNVLFLFSNFLLYQKFLSYLHHIFTYIIHTSFSGAPCGAFQQPIYNKCKVLWLRVLARPLLAVHNGFLSETLGCALSWQSTTPALAYSYWQVCGFFNSPYRTSRD